MVFSIISGNDHRNHRTKIFIFEKQYKLYKLYQQLKTNYHLQQLALFQKSMCLIMFLLHQGGWEYCSGHVTERLVKHPICCSQIYRPSVWTEAFMCHFNASNKIKKLKKKLIIMNLILVTNFFAASSNISNPVQKIFSFISGVNTWRSCILNK